MKAHLKQAFAYVATSLLLLGFATIAATTLTNRASSSEEEAATRRHYSYLLADELRQSSDDLTRLARTYVATGDAKWEKQYFEILDIRNGKLPRPQGYERIYWDFRAADLPGSRGTGEAVALLDLMKRAGFSEAELAKLAEAKANSDDLVRTETIAMNMVKGLYDDGKGGFTRQDEPDKAKALSMVHDLTYHQYKAKIMKPVDEFLTMLDVRTSAELSAAVAERQRWFMFAIIVALVFVLVLVTSMLYLWRRISAVLADVNRVATGVAAGQLDQSIALHEAGEEGELLRTLNGMQQRLLTVVSTIRGGADSVATASAEIAQGNADLSQRTEQQASALEETAATMEQLNTMVRSNADSARQANQLALASAGVATQGGYVVGQVVSTMQGISESSRKIGDIIGVIDGIAFQTNILALNAAVEAARAGEQGRGFAVVAGEVRSLAQRSAEAAKEIKGLITRNVDQVEQGTALVGEAGKTMDEIVTSIKRVSDIVGEISSATEEQSNGIQQVGDAVSKMDQGTQQNAALVEQSAAAAESLQKQAEQLVQAVAVFKLSGGAGVSSHVAPIRAVPAKPKAVEQKRATARAPVAPVRRLAGRTSESSEPARTKVPAPSASSAKTDGDDWTSF